MSGSTRSIGLRKQGRAAAIGSLAAWVHVRSRLGLTFQLLTNTKRAEAIVAANRRLASAIDFNADILQNTRLGCVTLIVTSRKRRHPKAKRK